MKFVSSNKDFNTLNNLGDIFSHNLFHENLKEVSKIEKEQESH